MARLFRVIVPVDEIDRAAEFYSTVLGDEGRRVSGRASIVAAGSSEERHSVLSS